VCEKLVVAAYHLEQERGSPFSAEDLVVAAWRAFPNTFGLSGHHDDGGQPIYPDSNRVFAEVMGSKPVRKRGLLAKVGKKMYELTETGRELGRQLSPLTERSGDTGTGGAKSGLSRQIVADLRRLLGSRAVEKVGLGQSESLTFHDACLFWGITPHSSAIDLEGKLADMSGKLSAARRVLAGSPARFAHGGPELSVDSIDLIFRVHASLRDRFQEELETIMQRKDERRHA
jgi:hypothetical protein